MKWLQELLFKKLIFIVQFSVLLGALLGPWCWCQSSDAVNARQEGALKVKKQATAQTQVQPKWVKDAVKFSASIERETLQLITDKKNFDNITLFSLAQFALVVSSGEKMVAPNGLDCKRYRVEKDQTQAKNVQPTRIQKYNVFRTCLKNPELVFSLQVEEGEFEITFFLRKLGSIVGSTAAIVNPDVRCQIKVEKKEVSQMDCQNWSYSFSESEKSTNEIRLKKFIYQKKGEPQLVAQGGFYKDLYEVRKIEIKAPKFGTVTIKEKEIDVRDDFSEENLKKMAEQKKRFEEEKKKTLERHQKWLEEAQQENQPVNQPKPPTTQPTPPSTPVR